MNFLGVTHRSLAQSGSAEPCPLPPPSATQSSFFSEVPRSRMTFGWLKSFMQAASLRNSSISRCEKLSTKQTDGPCQAQITNLARWDVMGKNNFVYSNLNQEKWEATQRWQQSGCWGLRREGPRGGWPQEMFSGSETVLQDECKLQISDNKTALMWFLHC